jgi:tripartite-type tricarboxylate transporter receptor subunit TctC
MKRPCLALAIAFAGLALPAATALAQSYPSKPVRVIVPFAAGGAVDSLARVLSAKLADQFNQPVVVENRTGAGGNIGADAVAKSAPDGYTILQNTNGQAISPAIYRSLPFDTVKDFIPVTQLVATATVLVANPKLPATSVGELVALAEGEARRSELRHDRRRQRAAPDHGDVQARGRDRHPGHPLSRRCAAQRRAHCACRVAARPS